MRPGRADDLPAMTRLLEHAVQAGMRGSLPPDAALRRAFADFDWEACSRVAESDGRVEGMVLVTRRPGDDGTVTRVEAAVAPGADAALLQSLTRWGLGLSRAAGARVAQVWSPHGRDEWLAGLGLEPVRPWWRMDRTLAEQLPQVAPVDGYRLLDPLAVPSSAWAKVFNLAFADHWRYWPRAETTFQIGEQPELALMAADAGGEPAAMALCEIVTYRLDPRPQPVGIVGSVGTLPAHRRRGLARWLVAESLVRLRAAGARTASLFVDGKNETRAADLYEDLGFRVTFDTTVWEATFP